MSDLYLPELIELDSYWQKAVEDAIYDTLKGEKRLHIALRNRKKINRKLEDLGLKHSPSQLHFSNRSKALLNSPDNQDVYHSGSEPTVLSIGDDSQGAINRSRSWSRPGGESAHKSPERPLLGDGSLEKIKKSQNSFNFEPMGDDNLQEELTDSEKEEMEYSLATQKPVTDLRNSIEWLHVRKRIRDETDFEESDAGSSFNADDGMTDEVFEVSTSKSKKFFEEEESHYEPPEFESEAKTSAFSRRASMWENGVLTPLKECGAVEHKLHLALAKRDIINSNLQTSNFGTGSASIEINRSVAKVAEKRRRKSNMMSPFVRFYLEVYRELCHKYSVRQITEEATKRWRAMSSKKKMEYSKSNQKDQITNL